MANRTRTKTIVQDELAQVIPDGLANKTVKPLPFLRAGSVQEGDLSTEHDFAEVTGVHKTGPRVTIDVAGGTVQRLAHKRFSVVRVVR